MAGLSANQQQFLNAVVQNTGLHPGVVAAWMAAEEPIGARSGFKGTQDWLNIGITDSGPRGQGNQVWQNPVAAGKATAQWIKGQWNDPGFGNAAPGIRAIAGTAGRSPQAQIAAIQHSGWASSGYPDLPGLFRQYAGTKAGGSIPAMPGQKAPGGGGGLSVTPVSYRAVTTNGFDQQGYNKALAASIAGNYLSGQKDPFAAGQPKTGLTTAGAANPLLSSGALSTVTPNVSDYATAQTQLEKIAGQTVVMHPNGQQQLATKAIADAKNAGAGADAQKLLRMIKFVSGAQYSQANHDAIGQNEFSVKARGTDCSGLISWLMGPQGLGIWSSSLATPGIPNAPGLRPGKGNTITIWNNRQAGNAGHVFIQIGNQFFASEGGIGVHQLPMSEVNNYLQHGSDGGSYQAFHPRGL